MTDLCPVLRVTVLLAILAAPSAGQIPVAAPNDQRTAAGTLVDGELRIELEAIEAAWYPRGENGVRIVTPLFAEVGRAPTAPGPLLRAVAGTPVRVTVHNRLTRAIRVGGLQDRKPGAGANGRPAFVAEDPLDIPPGESRTSRFTPEHAVSSFYYGRTVPERGAGGPPPVGPGLREGVFMGAFVIDAPAAPAHPDERILMLTRWGSPDEPGSLGPSWKVMVNGRSWPHTERIELAVGDTAHWRVINASLVDHPMHLHGFYFTVDATGDTQADTVFAPADRRLAVTEMMEEFSSLRLRWVPERPGNWLFHCHLVRHMGELQRFQIERSATGESADHMDMMAGLITGISVRPGPHGENADPPPSRRIDLWTGSRPRVYDGAPELGFVVQEGAVPAPDSTRVPGSPLVLTRGEPTEIVIHNRLGFPLSVHWHGLELRSLYDGVGHWSGSPGLPRPPVAPNDSQRVVIEPVRAGTFFYHTHGEPGHELTQGLYGAFLVVEPGAPWDPVTDRVFMLGSRGATIDAPPAINGRSRPPTEHFEPGRSYRLRFAHISADEFKRVRLLREGAPVVWRRLAKDGADLPPATQVDAAAELSIGVGEAHDVAWRPDAAGVYVLEVTTEYYPSRGGSTVQRVAFAVGDVSDADARIALTGTALSLVELTAAERARYVGAYRGAGPDGAELLLSVWEQRDGLVATLAPAGRPDGAAEYLIPLGEHRFARGERDQGLVRVADADQRIRFIAEGESMTAVELSNAGDAIARLERTQLTPSADQLRRYAGTYRVPNVPVDFVADVRDGVLHFAAGGPAEALIPISPTRFRAAPGTQGLPADLIVQFVLQENAVELVLDVGDETLSGRRAGGD